jgi:hypothetical protein
MKKWLIGGVIVAALAIGVAVLSPLASLAQQTQYRAPRTPDGKPDLNGVWQALNNAHWDIEDHVARQGPVVSLGAAFSIPEGHGIVEGGELPYRPEMMPRKKDNLENWISRDPEVKCFLPGVPRATYMPYPFQIVQTPANVLMAYEYANASRTIYMTEKLEEAPNDFWMGWSKGRWEGDTLVVDVTGFNGETWFDRAGNFHSDALHVVERYTRTGPDHLLYEATIEDPKVFTRPWKMRMPLYRRVEQQASLGEYICVEFAEELMYGHLRKRATSN